MQATLSRIEARNRSLLFGSLSLFLALVNGLAYLTEKHRDLFVRFAGPILFVVMIVVGIFHIHRAKAIDSELMSSLLAKTAALKARLGELENLKKRNLIEPDQYAAQKQKILQDI
jgi:hypothetical protein